MNPFEMVIGIVLIVTIGRVLSARYGVPYRSRSERRAGLSGMVQADPDAERMRDEIKTLKDRIAVLERITTDNNSAINLDREIEKLR